MANEHGEPNIWCIAMYELHIYLRQNTGVTWRVVNMESGMTLTEVNGVTQALDRSETDGHHGALSSGSVRWKDAEVPLVLSVKVHREVV